MERHGKAKYFLNFIHWAFIFTFIFIVGLPRFCDLPRVGPFCASLSHRIHRWAFWSLWLYLHSTCLMKIKWPHRGDISIEKKHLFHILIYQFPLDTNLRTRSVSNSSIDIDMLTCNTQHEHAFRCSDITSSFDDSKARWWFSCCMLQTFKETHCDKIRKLQLSGQSAAMAIRKYVKCRGTSGQDGS